MPLRSIVISAAATVIGLALGSSGTGATPVQGAETYTTPSDSAAEAGSDCYPPIVDPVSASYVAMRVIEIPGASYGPDLPTCAETPAPPGGACFIDVVGVDVDCG